MSERTDTQLRGLRQSRKTFLWVAGFLILAAAATTWHFTHWNVYWIWLAILSVVTFGFYGFDKYSAVSGIQRVPEFVLHLMALAGGFPGAWFGRVLFRHKLRKSVFTAVILVATILHVALWFYAEGRNA